MALTDGENGNGMVMPVAPMYGGGNGGFGNGFGGDWAWIILLLLLGWGNNGNGGFANSGFGGDYPWLANGQQNIMTNTNNNFRDQMINDGINGIRDGIHGLSTQLCNCCSDTQMALANGFAGVEQGANARQMANMQSIFGVQSALQECCCENRANIADLKYTVATENCADRTAAYQNTRDIIDSQTRGTQAILNKLCQLELDGVKAQVDAKNDRIVDLQNQLNMASLRESQAAQNAFIAQGFSNEVDQLYTRLSNCPVPSVPVYGRQNIFQCNQQTCGCGCGNF
jgi:hypothetical protein